MKISECDIDCYLIDWYGIDKNGYVFTAYSTGTSCVPEFVVIDYMNGSKERELLDDFFIDAFEGLNVQNKRFIKELEEYIISKKDISDELKNILHNKLNDNAGDIIFALKGITPFEILDGLTPRLGREFRKHPYHYKKMINPNDILNTQLLHFDQLPENIKKIMDSYRVDIDVQKDDYFYIPSVFDSPLFEQD